MRPDCVALVRPPCPGVWNLRRTPRLVRRVPGGARHGRIVAVKGAEPTESEIEWQLDALDLRPVERWLAGLPGLPAHVSFAESAPDLVTSTVTALPRPAERLVDTYLDTADWRIGRSGFVLRVRHRGGRGEVTLKDVVQAKAGLRRRLEVTEPLPARRRGGAGTPRAGGLAPAGPGRQAAAAAGARGADQAAALRPVVSPTSGWRRWRSTTPPSSWATTTSPCACSASRSRSTAPWVKRLTPLVDTLRRECGLQPATLSKFEAGLLAAGLRMPPPPDLGPVSFDANPSVGDVAFAVLRRSFNAVLAHETGTRLGEDPEELHDMRVATRRTRAALSLFEDALPVRARHVRNELGWLAGVLGAVRDLDVQLERMEGWIRGIPRRGPRRPLRPGDAARPPARGRPASPAGRAWTPPATSALVAGFATMLRQGPSRRSAAARAPCRAPSSPVSSPPGTARPTRRRAGPSAAAKPTTSTATRIRVKRLRYALEFVSEIYDKRTAKYVRHVVKLQDALGLMQDARVAAAKLHELATAEGSGLSPTTVFVMGGVTERYRHESDELARKVPGPAPRATRPGVAQADRAHGAAPPRARRPVPLARPDHSLSPASGRLPPPRPLDLLRRRWVLPRSPPVTAPVRPTRRARPPPIPRRPIRPPSVPARRAWCRAHGRSSPRRRPRSRPTREPVLRASAPSSNGGGPQPERP